MRKVHLKLSYNFRLLEHFVCLVRDRISCFEIPISFEMKLKENFHTYSACSQLALHLQLLPKFVAQCYQNRKPVERSSCC